MIFRFTIASTTKIKCLSFIFRVQGHQKYLDCITDSIEKLLDSDLQNIQTIKGIALNYVM